MGKDLGLFRAQSAGKDLARKRHWSKKMKKVEM